MQQLNQEYKYFEQLLPVFEFIDLGSYETMLYRLDKDEVIMEVSLMDEIFKLTTIDSSGDIYLVCEGLDFEFRLVELDENESIGTQVITGFEDFRTLISNIVSLFEVTIIDMGYEQITLPEFNWNMFNELVELDGLYYNHQELDGVVSELLTEEDVKEILRDVVTTAAQQFTETGILIGDQ